MRQSDMRRNFALRPGFRPFLSKLALALPANLAIFWLLVHGDAKAVLLYGAISGLLGALLLMRLEDYVVFSGATRPAADLRHRAEARQPERYAGHARGVVPSAGWLRER